MFALLGVLVGCSPDVISMYAKERDDALRFATDHPTVWEPDAQLRFSSNAIATAVGAGLKASVSGDLPTLTLALPLSQQATLLPHLVVDNAKVQPSDICSPCLEFDGNLLGKVNWTVMGLTGSFPFEVAASGVLKMEVVDGKDLRARLQQIRSVRVRVMELAGFSVNPSTTLEKFLQALLLQRLQPIQLTRLDTSSIPIRDLRLSTSAAGLQIDLLTNLPESHPLPPLPAATGDVELAISEGSLLGLARRAAFTTGTLSMDIAADPRVLMVNGDQFTLGLRLWRLVGRGWWRDYTVSGKLVIEDGNLRLKPQNVDEGAKSRGAGLVDPLAALFEGTILSTVEKGMRQSLPGSHHQNLGDGVQVNSVLSQVEGKDGALIVRGKISVSQGTAP